MIVSTQAIVRVGHERNGDSANLKRLSLFFDRILYVLPDYWLLKDEVINDPRRAERLSDGKLKFRGGIDPFNDTVARAHIPVGQLGGDLDHVLGSLVNAGIAEECEPLAVAAGSTAFDLIRREIGWLDAEDERFLALSKTTTSALAAEYQRATTVKSSGQEGEVHSIVPSNAMRDSSDLTTTLLTAQLTGSSPIFIRNRQIAELAYRYEQYKDALDTLRDQFGDVLPTSEYKNQLGSVGFHLSNLITDSALIEEQSIEGIVELRASMEDARKHFVSEHLVHSTNLVEGNPWNQEVRDELDRYVQGPLSTALLEYQDESLNRYQRLFGTIPGYLAELPQGIAVSAGIELANSTGVTAQLLPGTISWFHVVIAGLAVGGRRLPDFLKDVMATKQAEREARRSSIAYVAAIAQRK